MSTARVMAAEMTLVNDCQGLLTDIHRLMMETPPPFVRYDQTAAATDMLRYDVVSELGKVRDLLQSVARSKRLLRNTHKQVSLYEQQHRWRG